VLPRPAHILAAIDPATGQPLDDVQVKAEVATFMAAGFETTSHAITWCLTMLVRLGSCGRGWRLRVHPAGCIGGWPFQSHRVTIQCLTKRMVRSVGLCLW